MRIVDSHCHAARGWYEPIEVLLSQLDRNGVELAALIQGEMWRKTQGHGIGELGFVQPDRPMSAIGG